MSIILKVILLFFFTNFINAEWSDENCWSKIPKFQNCYMRYLHYFSIFYPTDFETYDEKIQESLVGNFDGTCAEFVALKACIISLKDCVSQELFVNSIAMNSDDGNNYYVNYKQMEYTCGQGFNDAKNSVKCLDSMNFTICGIKIKKSCDSVNSHLKCITNQAQKQCGSSARSFACNNLKIAITNEQPTCKVMKCSANSQFFNEILLVLIVTFKSLKII